MNVLSSMAWGKAAGRYVSLLVAFCFALNGLAFRVSVPDAERAMLDDILAAQSSVIRLCSLSTLPLKIVYNLMGLGDTTGTPAVPSPSKEAEKTDDHSSDSAITASSPRLLTVKNHAFIASIAGHVFIPAACLIINPDSRPCSIPPDAWHIMFILAILCHILARSGIPAAFSSLFRYSYARRALLAGFFYFNIKTLTEGRM